METTPSKIRVVHAPEFYTYSPINDRNHNCFKEISVFLGGNYVTDDDWQEEVIGLLRRMLSAPILKDFNSIPNLLILDPDTISQPATNWIDFAAECRKWRSDAIDIADVNTIMFNEKVNDQDWDIFEFGCMMGKAARKIEKGSSYWSNPVVVGLRRGGYYVGNEDLVRNAVKGFNDIHGDNNVMIYEDALSYAIGILNAAYQCLFRTTGNRKFDGRFLEQIPGSVWEELKQYIW